MTTLAASWMTSFNRFTTFHLVVVLICITLIAGAIRIGLRLRGTPAEPRFRALWAIITIATQLSAYIWWYASGNFDPLQSWPLHLCGIAVWISAIAIALPWRAPRAILYFWGLALCLQGFVTPLKLDGLSSPRFYFFWLNHLQIVGSALYLVIVLRFRPSARDFAVAVAASLVYIAAIIPLNLANNWNYGYLGRDKPRTGNVIDLLGKWPWRPFWIILLGHGAMLAAWLIWKHPRLRHLAQAPADPRPSTPPRSTSPLPSP